MKYSQPFDQPSNANAPYIDGNPAAGIQGSIVPAAGIEFDQREIVEVINTANVRRYTDFNGGACNPPANTDLTQLRKAIEGYIQYWFITRPVTYKVHGPNADFADLNAALDFLSHFRITQTGSVTLQLHGQIGGGGAALQFVYGQSVIFTHPDNDKISVVGATLLGGIPTSDAGYQLNGNGSSQRAADTAANLTMLRTKFATELHFVSGAGMVVRGKGINQLDGILITGDASGPAGLSIDVAQWLTINMGLAFVGFSNGTGLLLGSGAGVLFSGVAPLICMGNSIGILLADASSFTMSTIVMSYSNASHGLAAYTGSGVQNDLNGAYNYFECNGGDGVVLFAQAYYAGSSGTFTKTALNGLYGLDAFDNSMVGSGAAYWSYSNTLGAARAANKSLINVGTGSSFVGASSPAVNTSGNNDALIIYAP